ncbi:MAG: 3-hydroxyacyl-CoA dehydrogenase NAD-binding domain-containing protein [bacterium]
MEEVANQEIKSQVDSVQKSDKNGAFRLEVRENGVAFLIFDVPGEKVNILSSEVMTELNDWLEELKSKAGISALVFLSGKEDNFIAGADVAEIKDVYDPAEGAEKARKGQAIFQKIHDLPFPVVAAIQGACVGGGLELALACHFRIAKVHPKTKIGLPEVRLGILPGFGGTQRLPRLIGIQRALKLILTGKLVDAKWAGKLGIVDKVLPVDYPFSFMKAAAEEFAYNMQRKFARSAYEKKRNAKKLHALLLESNPFGRKILFEQAKKQALRTTRGHYPAPLKALEAVQKGIELPLQEGLEVEARLLGELIATEESKNLISLYYLNEALKKDAGVDKVKQEVREIKNVALLGAGVMGGGIAQYLADHEFAIRMKDINEEAVNVGLKRARQIFQKALDKKKINSREMQRKWSLISGTTDYSGFSQLDFVIEAIVENLEIKKAVFSEVEEKVKDSTILASNTSSLSITEIASAVKKPERVIGFHFFNPVHRMPLVEIIRGEKTSDETTITTVAFAKRMGKIPIVVKNSPGFLVNRILAPYINEATLMVEEGAKIDAIDRAMLDFGMPMGPLNLLDEVGIDVGYKVAKIMQKAFTERVTPSKVIARVNEDGRLGKKGGKGFYIYEGKNKIVDHAVYGLLKDLIRQDTELSQQDMQNRLIFVMLKEAVLCLEEEIVRRPRDVDAGMIFGTGFPPFRGGLLKYADSLGLTTCVERMLDLQKQFGDRFEPPCLLQKMAEKNAKFYENDKN